MCPRCRPSQQQRSPDTLAMQGDMPDVSQLRIPLKYLANLLTAGDTAPVARALERMLAPA